MPVRDAGGISRANLAGVVHLQRNKDVLNVALNVNRRMSGATVIILNERSLKETSPNKTSPSETASLLQEKADLAPERLWKKEVPIPDGAGKLTFQLRDSNGAVLLKQTEGQYDWVPESQIQLGPQGSYKMPEENRRTADDWLQMGKDQELNGKGLAR